MKYQVKITKQRPQDWYQSGDVYEFETLEEAEAFREEMHAKGKHTESVVKVETLEEFENEHKLGKH